MEKLSTVTLTILIFLTVSLCVLGIVGLAVLVEDNMWAGVTILVALGISLSYMTARLFKS